MEQSNVKNCIEDTVVTIFDSDSDDNNEQKNMVRFKNYISTSYHLFKVFQETKKK